MTAELRYRILLTVTQLESRNLLAASWPVAPPAYPGYDLLQTYGQLERIYGSPYLRMHSGIDIVAAAGTPVTAIADGKVYNEPNKGAETGYLSRMTITNPHRQDPTPSGWTYLHLAMRKNVQNTPPTDYLQEDVIDSSNRTFADVAPYPDSRYPSHLHLEWTSGADTNLGSYWLRPTKDPLDLLDSGGDLQAPVVEQIHFKSGEMNAGGDSWGSIAANGFENPSRSHRYFTSLDYAGNLVVGRLATTDSMDQTGLPGTDVIDIVGETYDRYKTDGRKLGINIININIQSKTVVGILHADAPFVFKDEFTADPNQAGAQTHNSMYDSATVRTAYTVSAKFHDAYDLIEQSSSPQRVDYVRNFFYTLTNFNQNQVIEPSDKSNAWAPTSDGGSQIWNDPTKPRAANNAKSMDPDGYYDVQVNAADQAGNVGTRTRRILLDDWSQSLGRDDKTDGVYIWGSQFTANADVPVYLITQQQEVQPGDKLSEVGTLVYTAKSDANGEIAQVKLPAFSAPQGFYLIADYGGGDNIFQPQLDAKCFSNIASPARMPPGSGGGSDGFAAGSAAAPTPNVRSDTPSVAWPVDDPTGRRSGWAGTLRQPDTSALDGPSATLVPPSRASVDDDGSAVAHSAAATPVAGVPPAVIRPPADSDPLVLLGSTD